MKGVIKMRRSILAWVAGGFLGAVLVLAAVAIVLSSAESWTYNIVPVDADEEGSPRQIFLLNIDTGESWLYRPVQGGGENKWHPVGWIKDESD